jgi:diadenosine tetraphosphate (Ap4A) HIT family hydrolase
MTCPFCHLQHDGQPPVVLENEHCQFLQEPQEVLIGSGLIIPKAHRETVFDLTEEEWAATFSLLKQAKALLDAQHSPQGYNLGWNSGSVAGQEVFHAHLHVIPRYADEPLAGRGIRYWLKQPANKRDRFKPD